MANEKLWHCGGCGENYANEGDLVECSTKHADERAEESKAIERENYKRSIEIRQPE